MSKLSFIISFFLCCGLILAQDTQNKNPNEPDNNKQNSEATNVKDKSENFDDYNKYIAFSEIAEDKFRFKTAVKYRKKALKLLNSQNKNLKASLKIIEKSLETDISPDEKRYLAISSIIIKRHKILVDLEIACCEYYLAEDEKEKGGNTQQILIERKFIGKREEKVIEYQNLIRKYDSKIKFKKSYKYRILLKLEAKQFRAFINGKIKTYDIVIKRLTKLKKTKNTDAISNAKTRQNYYKWVKVKYENWLSSIIETVADELTPEFNMELHFFIRNQDKYSKMIELPASLFYAQKEKTKELEIVKARGNFHKNYPPKKSVKHKSK